jgi:predicted RNA-binding Zn ribbon-like protein
VDLNSYADLAVRLANSANQGGRDDDGLATVESYRALVADRPHLVGRVTPGDLEALRLLRDELRLIFTAAERCDGAVVAEKLNALLTRHPIHQQIVSHDGQHWHIHLVESGSAADRHAAGAIAGLTGLITDSGTERLGVCAAADCERVFIAAASSADMRYCSEQCQPKADVRALRTHGRTGQGPASTAAS